MNTYDAYTFAAWKHKAEEDWASVQILSAHEGPRDTICFHCQQLAEKYLKGFLLFHHKPLKRIHQLDELMNDCLEIDKNLQDLSNDASRLTQLYMPARYPEDYPEDATLEETEAAVQAATRVRARILAAVEALQEDAAATAE